MSQVLSNVKMLYEKYGDKIKSDQHLVLLYWREYDSVSMDKTSVNTVDILNRATSPMKILQSKLAYEVLKEEE